MELKQKLENLFQFTGRVAALSEEDVKQFAFSRANLQLHTKEDFWKAFNVLEFLRMPEKFEIPKEIDKKLFKKFVEATGGEYGEYHDPDKEKRGKK